MIHPCYVRTLNTDKFRIFLDIKNVARTDRRADGRTADVRTNRSSYRDDRTHIKFWT